jgi:ATP-binding cassette subfamily F protein uup
LNYLTIQNVSKYFGEKRLFTDISLYINAGNKIGLIAKNGTGKTTLLKILAGEENAEGEHKKIEFHPDIRIGYLKQEPDLDENASVIEEVFRSENPKLNAIQDYEKVLAKKENASSKEMEVALAGMEKHKAWDTETEIKSILTKLKVGFLDKPIGLLSGGQKKRVALAKILIDKPDFLILDEPTNHLDIEMIEWLEEFLSRPSMTLFLITHDRYFLENVCDHIVELDRGQLHKYTGSYADYLEKKEERMHNLATQQEKNKQLYKKELDWMRRQPKARTTKAKSRIQEFESLESDVKNQQTEEELSIRVKPDRMGSKVLEFHNVSKSFEDITIIKGFTYKFGKKERVGIVGPNGAGKSTITSLMTGELEPDTGKVVVGETVRFGHYRQEGMQIDENQRVIDIVREVADVIPMEKGKYMTAEQLLERFLFPRPQQRVFVSKLSGGEKRRLYLLTILMRNPNFLILDEPTNDLDIITLNVLEDYLRVFPGCLVIISHDRFFMDKLAEHIFALEGEGQIKDFPGNYTEYRNWSEEKARLSSEQEPAPAAKTNPGANEKAQGDTLSHEERKKLRKWEKKIDRLTADKEKLSQSFTEEGLTPDDMKDLSKRIKSIDNQIEEAEMAWMTLAEKA